MSALKSLQPLDEPRVLLIGAQPWLISQVSLLFAPHEIAVTALSDADFSGVDAEKIELNSLYKVIWWVDFSRLEIQKRTLEKLVALKGASIVVLGKLPEEIMLEHEVLPASLETEQRFFKTILSTLPAAQLFFGRDWLDTDSLVGPLAFALRGFAKQLLLDPEIPWFFSNKESFFQVISPSLIQPHTPHKVIVRGKSVMSTNLLKKCAQLFQRYYGAALDVMPAIASRRSPQVVGFVEVGFPIIIEKQLDEFIRRKSQWQSLAAALPSPVLGQAGREAGRSNPPVSSAASKQAAPDSASDARVAKKRREDEKILINQDNYGNEVMQEGKIEGELARIFHSNRSESKEKRIGDKVKIVRKIAKKSRKNKALFYGGMVTMALGGIVLLLWGMFTATVVFARQEMAGFLTAEPSAENQLYTSGKWTELLQTQTGLYEQFLGEELLGDGGKLAHFEQTLLRLQEQKQALSLEIEQYFLGVLGKGETTPQFPPALLEMLTETQHTLGEISADADILIQDHPEIEDKWAAALKNEQQQLAIFSQLPEVFTDIFGGNGKRTYAVLLQNNLELRPTGGFIQAVAFLIFDKGLLIDSQVVDVYELDSRLPGAVLAPAEIQKYLGEQTWYLRDSNWNPDFALAAQRATWFIQQASGSRVDGVWALNYSAIQEILAAAGPMELTEYDEVLTKDNLLERVEFHSDDELASASEEGREYAVTVFSQLLRFIQESPPEKAGAILASLGKELGSKQILMNFLETEQQEAMRKLEWSGEIINPTCPSQFPQTACLVDQIFQAESNVGLNRVNAYIRREVRHEVDLSGEKVSHTRTVQLENTARSQGWPLGTYKAYFRFVLDTEAEPTAVTIDGRKITGETLMIYGEGGRKVIGVLVEIPPEGQLTLELSYVTEQIPDTAFSFLLFDQKQSGVEDTPVTITFHNSKKRPVLIAPTAEVYGESLEFSLTQDDHLFAGASYQ